MTLKRTVVGALVVLAVLIPAQWAHAAFTTTGNDVEARKDSCLRGGGQVIEHDEMFGGGFTCIYRTGYVVDCTSNGLCTHWLPGECGWNPPHDCLPSLPPEEDGGEASEPPPGATDANLGSAAPEVVDAPPSDAPPADELRETDDGQGHEPRTPATGAVSPSPAQREPTVDADPEADAPEPPTPPLALPDRGDEPQEAGPREGDGFEAAAPSPPASATMTLAP